MSTSLTRHQDLGISKKNTQQLREHTAHTFTIPIMPGIQATCGLAREAVNDVPGGPDEVSVGLQRVKMGLKRRFVAAQRGK